GQGKRRTGIQEPPRVAPLWRLRRFWRLGEAELTILKSQPARQLMVGKVIHNTPHLDLFWFRSHLSDHRPGWVEASYFTAPSLRREKVLTIVLASIRRAS